MDGEAGLCITSGKIVLPPLARVMGVGSQQQQDLKLLFCSYFDQEKVEELICVNQVVGELIFCVNQVGGKWSSTPF